jgi:hypothetical protein
MVTGNTDPLYHPITFAEQRTAHEGIVSQMKTNENSICRNMLMNSVTCLDMGLEDMDRAGADGECGVVGRMQKGGQTKYFSQIY